MSESEPSHPNVPANVVIVTAERKSYSFHTAADLAGIHPDLLHYYCELGLFGAAPEREEEERVFDENAVYELRRIETFRRDFGINRQALPLVVNLLREVEHLEAELRFLRSP